MPQEEKHFENARSHHQTTLSSEKLFRTVQERMWSESVRGAALEKLVSAHHAFDANSSGAHRSTDKRRKTSLLPNFFQHAGNPAFARFLTARELPNSGTDAPLVRLAQTASIPRKILPLPQTKRTALHYLNTTVVPAIYEADKILHFDQDGFNVKRISGFPSFDCFCLNNKKTIGNKQHRLFFFPTGKAEVNSGGNQSTEELPAVTHSY
jgi:hypothetical protein